ncbi:MAG: hypothetical protein ACRCXC_08250 [Legionella sp.]
MGRLSVILLLPANDDNSWYTWLTLLKPTKQWLELVKSCRVSELGAYWFEPELLFTALFLFNTNNQSVKKSINLFLDELIHTYSQDKNDLMKQFRVNILFTEFINKLSEHHRINLLRLIKLCDPKIAKQTFLETCTKHINYRVSQLFPEESASLQFFPTPRKLNTRKLFKLPDSAKSIAKMVTEFKKQVPSLDIEPKTAEKIGAYLMKISESILSQTQKTKSGSRVSDYLGLST